MKQVYIIKKNNPKLLLFFAGWAADETPFKQYCPQGMDYMICYDYRTLDFDTSILEQYRQVNVVAWSMGVWAAPIALASVPKEKLLLIAFNDTITPIGYTDGIPEKTFRDTLKRTDSRLRSRSSCAACAKTAMPTKPSLPSLPAGTSTKLRKSWNSLRKNTPK